MCVPACIYAGLLVRMLTVEGTYASMIAVIYDNLEDDRKNNYRSMLQDNYEIREG